MVWRFASSFADSPGQLIGYAAVFDSLSENLGNFKERVASTAFDRALRDPNLDCKALINHDANLLIGRTKSGTLRLNTDGYGLRMAVDLPNTSYARDLLASVKRGDLNQMSFAFTADDQDWNDETDPDTGDSIPVRTLRAVRLHDVSCVTSPAYAATSVSSITPPRWNSLPLATPEMMFPQGVPAEVRSHVPNFSLGASRLKNFVSLLMGL